MSPERIRVRRMRDPGIEAAKLARAAAFFRYQMLKMNGREAGDAAVAEGARKIARGMPPFWDPRTRRYL